MNGNWLYQWGACKVCGGEIPHGHQPDCDIYKLERSLDFYKSRVMLLEQEKYRLNQHGLMLVVDILANCQLLPDPDGKRYGKAEAQPEPARQLCATHPEVNYKTAWGCPDCVKELREDVRRLRDAGEEALRQCDESHADPCPVCGVHPEQCGCWIGMMRLAIGLSISKPKPTEPKP